MALTPEQQQFVYNEVNVARTLYAQYALLTQLNLQWNGALGYSAMYAQGDLNAIPAFSAAGLTVQDLNDMGYAIGQLKAQVDGVLAPIIKLANMS